MCFKLKAASFNSVALIAAMLNGQKYLILKIQDTGNAVNLLEFQGLSKN
jgi:hypothetical protein